MTARDVILSLFAELEQRHSRDTFALAEIVAAAARRDTGYAESTIRTMVSSHLCVNAEGPTEHPDLLRVDRGHYRRLRPGENHPPPPRSRSSAPPTQPDPLPDLGPIDWASVWDSVADQLRNHVEAGRGHLLTEDSLRFSAALALEEHDVDPAIIVNEYRHPAVSGRIDQAVGPNGEALIEYKFPRDPTESSSADTMTLGELLKDFTKLSRVRDAELLIVQLLNRRLLGYLRRRSSPEAEWTTEPGTAFRITPENLDALPLSARASAGSLDTPLRALCVETRAIDSLTLVVYRIDQLETV